MVQKLPVSVVIPTFNMLAHLEPLLRSLKPLQPELNEILVVDDGSTDGTSELAKLHPEVRVLSLAQNSGRFAARLSGAHAATSEWLLFLDTRLLPQTGFLEAVKKNIARGTACVGWVEIDTDKNIFSLYWQRSHQFIFSRHYQIPSEGVELNLKNYDEYLKGTGIYLCRRQNFVDVCTELEHQDIRSDDTLILKKMLARERLRIDPELKVLWEPRDRLKDFLWRLVERGPGFVEYHVLQRQGLFFVAILIGLSLLGLWGVLLARNPSAGLMAAVGGIAAIGATTVLFAKSLSEFRRLLPLHTAVVFAFGFGVLYGLTYHLSRIFNTTR